MRVVAARLGVPERGARRGGRDGAADRRAAAAVAGAPPLRVFVAEWLDPPFAAGHWLPEMVDAAGGIEVLGRAGEPSHPGDLGRRRRRRARAARGRRLRVRRRPDRRRRPPGCTFPCRTVAVDANARYRGPRRGWPRASRSWRTCSTRTSWPTPGCPGSSWSRRGRGSRAARRPGRDRLDQPRPRPGRAGEANVAALRGGMARAGGARGAASKRSRRAAPNVDRQGHRLRRRREGRSLLLNAHMESSASRA